MSPSTLARGSLWENRQLASREAANTYRTVPQLLARNVKQYGDQPAYRFKELGIWQSWTWRDTASEIDSLALGLVNLGMHPGDHVAIIGRNHPVLYWAMVAVQCASGVPVPVYQDSVAEEMAYVLEHCSARFVVAENQEQVDKVLEVAAKLPGLECMIFVDPRGLRKYDRARLKDFRDVQQAGRDARETAAPELEQRLRAQDAETTCVMLYTSGTTGRPKGVVLCHRNVVEASRLSAEFDRLEQSDSVLAYLPMAWVGDFVFSIGQAYYAGFCVNCPESPDTMQADLCEIGPSYFFAPPRYFESLLTSVQIRMEDASRLKRWLFSYAMGHARKVGSALLDGQAVGLIDRLQYRLCSALVIDPLKNTLGMSRVRVGYTAGEAIGPEIFEFYRALGINLKQLYGQTEATVFVTMQPDGEVRADTVGVPAPGVEIRIDDSGEVHYRSPGTFLEYYKNPDSTASTKDSEGWVATGDAGFIEVESGHLRIIDRAKDVGKTASGAMFAPKYVENKLKFYPDILEAVVFGSGREQCTAFLNIDLSAVGNWAERNNLSYASYQELAGHPRVAEILRVHVETVNQSLAGDDMLSGCQIHRFLILHKELDPDDGEITRTRKVRRRVIEKRYATLLAALYDKSNEVFVETEVTYEDGRKGSISANLQVHDAKTFTMTSQAPIETAA